MVSSISHSRRVGCGNRLRMPELLPVVDPFPLVELVETAATPRQIEATSSRPSDSAPAEKSCPRWRIATNAHAHRTSVQPTAARGSQVGEEDRVTPPP